MLEIEYRPVVSLVPYAQNARTHSAAQVKQIAASIKAFGWTNPILIDGEGGIIAGHGRLLAANLLKMDEVPCIPLRDLTPEQRRALVLADNKLAENAGWNEDLLKTELSALKGAGFDLGLTGFSLPELSDLLKIDGVGETQGSLLSRIDITVAEPRHGVAKDEHYLLAERHHLLCVSVIEGWASWKPLLKGKALFCPYPGPFVPFGERAAEVTLIMVQPDPYIAGHILDRFADVHGETSIERVTA